MTILCDYDLRDMMGRGLVEDPDFALVNPASIDIRIGRKYILEASHGHWERGDLPDAGMTVEPGEFLLVDTHEVFNVPNGYAVELRLKSSTARRGWDHNAALWVDPGWRGRLTMELRNVLQYNNLTLTPGRPFAQAIVHRLSGESVSPYNGRYQGAQAVEGAKG